MGVDPSRNDSRVVIKAALRGHIGIVKYFYSLDTIDPGELNARVYTAAVSVGCNELVEFALGYGDNERKLTQVVNSLNTVSI